VARVAQSTTAEADLCSNIDALTAPDSDLPQVSHTNGETSILNIDVVTVTVSVVENRGSAGDGGIDGGSASNGDVHTSVEAATAHTKGRRLAASLHNATRTTRGSRATTASLHAALDVSGTGASARNVATARASDCVLVLTSAATATAALDTALDVSGTRAVARIESAIRATLARVEATSRSATD